MHLLFGLLVQSHCRSAAALMSGLCEWWEAVGSCGGSVGCAGGGGLVVGAGGGGFRPLMWEGC